MRLLHTSDWHLGIRHGTFSRGPDHDHFLGWLLDHLRAEPTDVLVVAGDIFDAMHPSASALQQYYRFLGQLPSTGVRQVVLVGGNHDSASRLQAPAEVLRALDVHVVGGLLGDPDDHDRAMVPIRDAEGRVGAVVLAVPYVHEFRLGIRTTDVDVEAGRRAFREAFGGLYRSLCDRARQAYGEVPLVATGHLTVGRPGARPSRDDYPQEIHQVGTLDALPPDLFDPRLQYVALGHIHRSYPVDEGRRIWYSGSPFPLSLPEARHPHRVLDVTLDPDPAARAPQQVEAVDVPLPRELVEVRAEPEAVLDRLRDLQATAPLPPLVFVRAVTDDLPQAFGNRCHEVLQARPAESRPVLAEVRHERITPLPEHVDPGAHTDLQDLSPAQVFEALCARQGVDGADGLADAFARLASASDDDFAAMVAAAGEGAS
jgi:DNA repair protein SbcD/Mre11